MRTRTILFALLIAAGSALATPTIAQAQEDEKTYQAMAQRAYLDAMADLENGDFLEAQRKFNIVRARYTYSQFSALSELRLGDVYYEQAKYASAIEQYRSFAKLHPNHKEVTYAAWRTALSFYGQMPEDWFFMPPAYEKELSRARDAEREFRYFLARYPKTEYTQEANRRLAQIRRRLADHEFYVAEFYLKRDNPRAAAMRLTYLLDKFSGLGLDARALFLLARSYILLGDTTKAKTALTDLIEYHGNDPLAAEARDYLAEHKL